MRLKQGTVSVLFGCHSIIHSLLVIRAWKILYGKYPKGWQAVCILLHDIGHWGRDYLDDYEQKKEHWRLGANICGRLFRLKGYLFTAGHCSHSGYEHSKMYRADKHSWHIAPRWWLRCNCWFEPKLQGEMTAREAIADFKEKVKQSVESGEYKSTHSFYLDRA